MSELLELMLYPDGEPVDLELAGEECTECRRPLADSGEEVAGLTGTDEDGLPGFALFHEGCLYNFLLRAL